MPQTESGHPIIQGPPFSGKKRRAIFSLIFGVALACATLVPPRAVQGAGEVHTDFWRTSTLQAFRAWSFSGAALRATGAGAGIGLERHAGARLLCHSGDIDGGATRSDLATGLCFGRDPAPARVRYYNGAVFQFGTLSSPVHRLRRPMDQLIASWNALTPPGTWLEMHVRLLGPSGWTRLFRLPIWASAGGVIRSHSVGHQKSPEGRVDTDTVVLPADRAATAYQIRITLFTASPTASPTLRLVTVVTSQNVSTWSSDTPDRATWGTDLAVPGRSQMAAGFRHLGYGGGGEAWCSPTSTSMVLAYWANMLRQPGLDRSVPEVARGVYDATYDGTGNWPFNTAYAGSLGLTAYVTRLDSMRALEWWIRRGVPIVISVAFRQGELPGEPVGASPGHLMVVRGFTPRGDVIVNDPAGASNSEVRLIFKRAAVERVWRQGSQGTAYVMYPPEWLSSHPVRPALATG